MKNEMYDLFAVVVHQGSLNGGHYTALAKNGESWFEFNDRYVVRLKQNDERKIINSGAYILFYQKRGIDFDKIAEYDEIKNKLVLDTLAQTQQKQEIVDHSQLFTNQGIIE